MSPQLFWSDWLKSTTLSLGFVAALSAGALWLVAARARTLVALRMGPFRGVERGHHVLDAVRHRAALFRDEAAARPRARGRGARAGRARWRSRAAACSRLTRSRRSSHSNAYFTGIGAVKRVVLFDTLFGHISHGEILAILAHELGHWRKHHGAPLPARCGLSPSRFSRSTSPSDWRRRRAFRARRACEAASFPARLFILAPSRSLASRSRSRPSRVTGHAVTSGKPTPTPPSSSDARRSRERAPRSSRARTSPTSIRTRLTPPFMTRTLPCPSRTSASSSPARARGPASAH